MYLHKQKGFTLIELLVVVAIIGILAIVVLASLGQARSRTRDAARLSDMQSIQKLLEIYYLDNGAYPDTGGWTSSGDPTEWATLATLLGSTLPVDPSNVEDLSSDPNQNFKYSYYGDSGTCNAQEYVLVHKKEGALPTLAERSYTWCDSTAWQFVDLFIVPKP